MKRTNRSGLRATRLRAALAAIEVGFADAAFSSQDVAHQLGVSARYVQNLMHDTGVGFTARVCELRLQLARTMLVDSDCAHLKVGEIATACGFNEIPYFNRCFRRRFGNSPSEYRAHYGEVGRGI